VNLLWCFEIQNKQNPGERSGLSIDFKFLMKNIRQTKSLRLLFIVFEEKKES
jgi:hypothetical protein